MGGGKPKSPKAPDPGPAIAEFKLGFEAIRDAYPSALEEYEATIKEGASSAIEAITGAQVMALPFSDTAKSAIGEIREFLGLKPISKTAAIPFRVRGLIDQMKVSGGPTATAILPQLDQLASMVDQAESATDPADRQARLEEIVQFTGALSQDPNLADIKPIVDNITREFTESYETTPGQALTGEDVQARIADLPGYQFQLAQGQQALERSAAAQGELLSGRTLAAAQEFGQSLSGQAYQSHLNRLTQLAAQNLPFAQQQISAQQQKAGVFTQQAGLLAGARKGTAESIAEAERTFRTQSGQAKMNKEITASQYQNQAYLSSFTSPTPSFGQTAGRIGGAVIGGAVGGPLGAAVGGAAGSFLGGLF